MKFEVEVDAAISFHNPEDREILHTILRKLNQMSNELDALTKAVADAKTVEDSAIVLLGGLKAQLDAAIATGNPVALQNLSDALGAESVKLAAAIQANTPGPKSPVFTAPTFPAAAVGQDFDFQFVAADAITFALGAGAALPDGLTMDSLGHVTGKPTTAGASTFSVTATNGAGTVDSGPLTLVVDAVAAPAPPPAVAKP